MTKIKRRLLQKPVKSTFLLKSNRNKPNARLSSIPIPWLRFKVFKKWCRSNYLWLISSYIAIFTLNTILIPPNLRYQNYRRSPKLGPVHRIDMVFKIRLGRGRAILSQHAINKWRGKYPKSRFSNKENLIFEMPLLYSAGLINSYIGQYFFVPVMQCGSIDHHISMCPLIRREILSQYIPPD